jgi:hypothetical protein
VLVVKQVQQWGNALSPICYYQIKADNVVVGFARYENFSIEISCDQQLRGHAYQACVDDLTARDVISPLATVTLIPIIGL